MLVADCTGVDSYWVSSLRVAHQSLCCSTTMLDPRVAGESGGEKCQGQGFSPPSPQIGGTGHWG